MKKTTERKMAYGLVIILFLVGVICYAAFPVTTPDPPVRIMFQSTAGEVLFDHKEHAAESGYAVACSDCHHDIEDPEERPTPCEECHMKDSDEDSPNLGDAFHTLCRDCHDESGMGPVECFQCHVI